MLGNTPAICRKCYIHPEIVNSYLDGGHLIEVQRNIDDKLREKIDAFRSEEAAVLSFPRVWIAKELSADSIPAPAPHAAKAALGSTASVEALQSA